MTSAHTSLAAARAPERLPWAALLQIPSTLAFKLVESVGSLWMIDLHSATACATPAGLVGRPDVVVGEDVDVATGGDFDVAVVVGDFDVVAVEAGWVTLTARAGVELLDVELLDPQPAMNTPASATTSHVERCLIIGPP
jgi:hypothetical protein